MLKKTVLKLSNYVYAKPKLKAKIFQVLNRFPKLKAKVRRVSGLSLPALPHALNQNSPQSLEQLTPSARDIYWQLKTAIDKKQGAS